MRPYQALRNEMYVNGISSPMLARSLRIGTTTLSRKLNGKSSWTLDECYHVLHVLRRPESDLTVLFPYKGHNEEEVPCRKSRKKG